MTQGGSHARLSRYVLSLTLATLVSGGLLSPESRTYALSGDEALGQLYRNARFWMNRGDLVRATEFWTRILHLRPNDPRALTNLGIVAAQGGGLKKANILLDRLSRSHPGDPGIEKIRSAILLGKLDVKWLLLARKERKEQHFSAAYQDCERYLKGSPPRGGLALEVLQTESAVPGHFRNAVRDLRQLAARHPESHRIRLVLARTLINREDTRREGLELLSVLSRSPLADVSSEARSSWRTALIWLHARPVDRKLYEAYLDRYPEDLVIRRLLSRIPKSDERGNGFHFLAKNRLLQANKSFQRALLADPSDKEAAWGLAIIRMKQKRFQETAEILSWLRRRQSLRPEQSSLFREAVYDENLDQSRQCLDERDVSEARTILATLIKNRPDRPEAVALMGESYRREDRADRALNRKAERGPHPFLAVLDRIRPENLDRARSWLWSKRDGDTMTVFSRRVFLSSGSGHLPFLIRLRYVAYKFKTGFFLLVAGAILFLTIRADRVLTETMNRRLTDDKGEEPS